ncbi:unnamed protein product (macronuclear) [Paramecium tetraurelia]|uniref:Uncharacterized protein n=1 Tax=Paramecium tetraurelia TaxID=5888 RepID=A0EAP6_PARTE|nr:uncharacterized protein GSPATT00025097001 [Paramecium tetraurelia]CAK92363.1 unnamed protein product [Paramecium tetraurelia]|eukprot:XP_001459760.1 hypothetical protein (macronuclear) [Paramecium tetraurelia strain d4-2]
MINDFTQLAGWQDYSQSSHTNQLKLLSESMEYSSPMPSNKNRKLLPNLCHIRQVTEIRSPRKKSLHSTRIQQSQVLYQIKDENPLKLRPANPRHIRVTPSQFNFTLSEDKFNKMSKDSSPTKQKLNKLAPLLQKVHKVQIKNKIITITQKSPLTQLQKLLDVLNEK